MHPPPTRSLFVQKLWLWKRKNTCTQNHLTDIFGTKLEIPLLPKKKKFPTNQYNGAHYNQTNHTSHIPTIPGKWTPIHGPPHMHWNEHRSFTLKPLLTSSSLKKKLPQQTYCFPHLHKPPTKIKVGWVSTSLNFSWSATKCNHKQRSSFELYH